MFNKQKILLLILGGFFAVTLVAYFLLIIKKDVGSLRQTKKPVNLVLEDQRKNVQSQQEKEVEELKQANKKTLKTAMQSYPHLHPIDKTDHVWGDLNAPVQLIIYDDFECPFCARFYGTTKEIKNYFGDKVVVVFRHFPLRFHVHAMDAALASECASEQGKFWEMYDKLFADNKAGRLSVEQFKKDAAELGLNQVQFNQCLETQKYKDKIEQQMLDGRNAGVSGTPGNFVNGRPMPGAYPFEDFKRGNKQVAGMKSVIASYLGEDQQ